MKDDFGTAKVLWDLCTLYADANSDQIAQDMEKCRQEAGLLAAAYAGRIDQLLAAELKDFIVRLECMHELLGRLGSFSYLNFITQTDNESASALMQRVEELEAEVGRETIFFQVEWNRLPGSSAERLLTDLELSKYRHYLQTLRSFSPYQLSLKEEELLKELFPVGRSAWNVLFEKVMAKIEFGPEKKSEEVVLSELSHAERDVRRQASHDLTEGLRGNLHILTHIFNTLAAEKMIDDRLRRYPTWISAMNLNNELRPETVETLIEVVTGNYDIVHDYYHLKRNLLQVDELFDYDRYAPLPASDEAAISWDRCTAIVLDAFDSFSPDMAAIAEGFFEGRYIHAPVLPGKRGGAFAHSTVPSAHPYILVNYTGRIQDVFTVAHELGHGVHQVLAASQGVYNSYTPLVLAETASIFAEMLVFRSLLASANSAEVRKNMICRKLESIFATIFRQVAMNRFEKAMHEGRRSRGELSSEELSAFWMATQEPMFGDSLTLREDYRLWWSYIPHFLSTPGYVYAYAFGELLVLALYARYQEEGQDFVKPYLNLLQAGGSADPYALLKPFGVDLGEKTFWQGGLAIVRHLFDEAK